MCVKAKGKEWARPGNHVGNGPFKLVRWLPNDHVLAEKTRAFSMPPMSRWNGSIYYPTDDYGAALQRMRAGELDIQDAAAGSRASTGFKPTCPAPPTPSRS